MAPRGHETGASQVNAFHVGDAYLFRQYFEGEAVFARLRRYYDHDQYRFAVPSREFDGVSRFLAEQGYELDPVTSLERYAVVVRKYTAHPDGIFKESVLQWDHADHTVFLLQDATAVERAVTEGATHLADSPLSVTISGQQRLSTVEG